MLLILAHAHDLPARALAARWGSRALLLTVAGLHRWRWRLDVAVDGRVAAELAAPDGTPVPVTGVVNRLGWIAPADLARVHPVDREYAAAELTAFLLAWLDACPAPVLNPPGPRSLNGPAWSAEQWADAAASAGLRAGAVHRRLSLAEPPVPVLEWTCPISAHVVGDVCVGAVHPLIGTRLCALAKAAGISLLTATVSGPGPRAAVRDISAWPDVGQPEVADALAALLPAADLAEVTA